MTLLHGFMVYKWSKFNVVFLKSEITTIIENNDIIQFVYNDSIKYRFSKY